VTWVAWRQQRIVIGLFAVAAVLLIWWAVSSGLHEQSLWHQYLGPPCHNGRGVSYKKLAFCRSLYNEVHGLLSHNYLLSDFAQFFGLVMGVVLGVTAIASELERKTVRLAWTQSLTRTRWLVAKTSVGLVSIVVLIVPLSVTFSWWVGASRIGPRIQPTAYPLAGWLLGVYAVSIFILTMFLGALIRRAGPTVAVVVLVIIATSLFMTAEGRTRLVPIHTATTTFRTVTKGDFSTAVPKGGAPTNSWILFSGFAPIGTHTIPGEADQRRSDERMSRCESTSGANSGTVMNSCLRREGLRDVSFYVADHEFWQLQLREGGLYLTLDLLLFGGTVVLLRRIRV